MSSAQFERNLIPPEVVESEDFLKKVARSMDYPQWDTLRMVMDAPDAMQFYGAFRPRNDGLRYFNLTAGYEVGYEIDEARHQVTYKEWI